MRLNQFIALHSEYSRRAADKLIENGHIRVNGEFAKLGQTVMDSDEVYLHNQKISSTPELVTILFNKPVGCVCSRNGQGSKTIYDILPMEYRHLNPVGRLDKESSGLLLLTNDGQLANKLTHPKYQKIKRYEITLDKPLQPLHQQMISDHGLTLKDGLSRFMITKVSAPVSPPSPISHILPPDLYEIEMFEGRNRQIRRTFAALNYRVMTLHRTQFGDYSLADLKKADIKLTD